MKLINYIAALLSIFLANTSYSGIEKFIENQSDRVIIKDNFLILADEPGLINCPNTNCDIPVNIKSFRKEEGKYIPISTINSSKINSGNHTLYQYNDKIIDSFSTRNQSGQKDAIFKTHLRSFDFTNPENPILLASLNFRGDILASTRNGNRLTNLSSDIVRSNDLSSVVLEECGSLTNLLGRKIAKSEFLMLRIIDTPLKNINESQQHCLIIDKIGIKNSSIKSTKNSIYITYSNNRNQRHIIRYKYEQDTYSFDNNIIINENRFSKNWENYIQESEGILMIAGNYKFETNIQAGIKTFSIIENKIVTGSERNISFTPRTHTRSSIETLSESINNRWYIAINSDDFTSGSKLLNVDISVPSAPNASSEISITGNIERIIPIYDDLFSIYARQLKIPPATSLSIIDTSNTVKSHLVYSESLTEGFDHQPLAIENKLTQSAYFKNQYSGKLITPLENTQNSPLIMKTSLVESNSGKDVPSKRKIDLITIDLFKYENCFSLEASCWIAEKSHINTLIVPYEGDEPSRARSLIDKVGYYYVLGDDIQFFPY